VSDSWISPDTEAKERDFHGVLWTHATMCKSIIGRRSTRPYLYVDLYAGPGNLEFRGRQFAGSPLVARDVLAETGMPYLAVHYERDPAVAARLAEALWVPTSLLDAVTAENAPVYVEPCQAGFPRWLDENGRQPDRYGLVYADPIRDEIPHDLLNAAARIMPKVDLLSYVSANQYKRRRGIDERLNGANATRPFLLDHIQAVKKRVVLIREPLGKWEFTFVLWTDWDGYPAWEKRGFYRLDSPRGQAVLDRLNLSKGKRHARDNTPLWSDDVA
jgi:hypothetical protein